VGSTWRPGSFTDTFAGTGSGSFSVVDVNGDGRSELVFSGNDGAMKAAFFNADGTVASTLSSVARNGVQSLGQQISADFNGDGVLDSIFMSTNNQVSVAFGYYDTASRRLTYSAWNLLLNTPPAGFGLSDWLNVADIDGDGKADLLWTKVDQVGAPSGAVTIQRNTSIGFVASVANTNTAGSTSGMGDNGVGLVSWQDINGDGLTDLVRSNGNVSSVRLGQADASLRSSALSLKQITVNAGLTLDLSALTDTQAVVNGDDRSQTFVGANWSDQLMGGAGNDILRGEGGSDWLVGGAGNDALLGGTGADALSAGAGNNFLAGGVGNDVISTGLGADVIAFNRGDGQDTVISQGTKNNTLSLGGGIKYADLSLLKAGTDLELRTNASGSEKLVLQDWFASANNRSFSTLQLVIEGTTDYVAGSTDAMRNNKVERFNFAGLANQFDTARAANPGLTSWAISSALAGLNLGGSDTAAIGGDLAYGYARNTLSMIGNIGAGNVLAGSGFGTTMQAFQSDLVKSTGTLRLG
jgi:hypothetical protein